MGALTSVLALIVTLGILVTIHEYGHFWVARRCGVKVLRFSVGFGKVLWSSTDKYGTEFAIAAIPLGGYVKMLDEREAPVPEELLDQAFNRKTVWQRMAVVLAGPAANFLFAIFAYWLMFVVGITQVKPVIGGVEDGSIAALANVPANQEITQVDGTDVNSWQDVSFQLLSRIGDTGSISLTLDNGKDYELNIERWLSTAEEPNVIGELGLSPFRPKVPPVIKELQPGLAAEQAGLKAGDTVLSIDGQAIDNWVQFVEKVKASPGKALSLDVEREGSIAQITLIPASKALESGETVGFVGAMVKMPKLPEDYIRTVSYGPIEAITLGIKKTWDMSVVTLESIGKMLQGLLSVKNLSGPITIAKVADASAKAGFEAFISFLAYISVMLAVVNLLPIPVLDGGHFLYYLVEAIKGSPVSEKVQLAGLKLGMSFLFLLMAVAIFNDISRL